MENEIALKSRNTLELWAWSSTSVSIRPTRARKLTEGILVTGVERGTRPLVIRIMLQKHIYLTFRRIGHHVLFHVRLQLRGGAIKAIGQLLVRSKIQFILA